jgi:hypothetical protein
MQYNTRAPELSATVNLVSLCIIFFSLYDLNGFLENPAYTPPLGLAQRTRLGNFHAIADLAGITRIMGHEFVSPADILLVQRMFDQPFDLHHNGFIHFVADHNAVHLSFISTCLHMRP